MRETGAFRLTFALVVTCALFFALSVLVAACAELRADAEEDGPAVSTSEEPTAETAAVSAVSSESERSGEAEEAESLVFDPAVHQIELQPLIEGLRRPVFVTHAGDGSQRLFIVEQPGTIRVWKDGSLLADPFLDIEEQVNDRGNEQGLLGLAFPPNYEESGFFFVNYTSSSGATVISRFQRSTDDPDSADRSSEFLVLQLEQPARNHNGGMLEFGPDGYLYVGTGDGGAANDRFGNGQNPNTLLGKMLRLDVTTDPDQPYLIPEDNPFVTNSWTTVDGEEVDVRDEVIAIGLRNPWRYSFDRLTGDLWIADVGQNAYEEVHFVANENLTPGAIQPLNFGWPILEGSFCFQSRNCSAEGLELPVSEYDHSGHCSVTGGYVYRGEAFPALTGVYLFADFCSGVMWATLPSETDGWQTVELLRSGQNISSFGEDEAGEIYLTSLGGTVYQVVVSKK